MKLYEFPPTRSLRVRWALQELGVPFEAITVNLVAGEGQQPAFKQISPAGKVPALVDGDVTLTESGAILSYLGEKYPEQGLIPRDLATRAQHNRWLLFTITELEQPLWRIARNLNLYPPAERVAADVPRAQKDFRDMAPILETHMRGRQYVVGDAFTMCDIVLAHTLDWANAVELLGDCPLLVAYMERMYQRPRAAPRIAQAFAQMRGS